MDKLASENPENSDETTISRGLEVIERRPVIFIYI